MDEAATHACKRTNIELRDKIELTSSLLKLLLDTQAFLLMLLAVTVLTVLVAIPNAPASVALQ